MDKTVSFQHGIRRDPDHAHIFLLLEKKKQMQIKSLTAVSKAREKLPE
jgi:hypothetical protein